MNSTLDAILGIVRRYPLGRENDNRHRQVFKDCEIATRNKVADLAVENSPDIMRRIAEFAIISYSNYLAEISLLFPPEARGTKGIIAKISTELALNDVNLVGIICNSPEDILLVTEADAPKALEALQRMLGEEAMDPNRKRVTSKIVLAN